MVNTNNEKIPKTYHQIAITQIIAGVEFAFAIRTAVELNLFLLLKDGTVSVENLANSLNLEPSALHRLLRGLQSIGLLSKNEDGNYIVTECGKTLIPDNPKSIYPIVKYLLHEANIQCMLQMGYSIKTGQSAFEKIYGNKYDKDNIQGRSYLKAMDKFMKIYSEISLPSLLNSYNFEKFNLIIDVGGGVGQLLTGILNSTNIPKGILFDLPNTINTAKNNIKTSKQIGRCQFVAGNMFKKIPKDGDLYVVSKVLNNWDDKHAINILKNIREAMSDNAKIIIIENVPLDDILSPEEAFRDLLFLATTHGGRVRNKTEFAALIKNSGLNLLNIIRTSSSYSIIECNKLK